MAFLASSSLDASEASGNISSDNIFLYLPLSCAPTLTCQEATEGAMPSKKSLNLAIDLNDVRIDKDTITVKLRWPMQRVKVPESGQQMLLGPLTINTSKSEFAGAAQSCSFHSKHCDVMPRRT